MIEIEDLQKIIEIVEKHDISHFEFEQEDSRVVIEKQFLKSVRNTDKINNSDLKVINECRNDIEDNLVNTQENIDKSYIKSNLAGTFYLRKEENAEPFVKLNEKINENTIVGLVEVMKLFNEIEAGVNGQIIDILVEDGDFVEYGQPLFEIKLS